MPLTTPEDHILPQDVSAIYLQAAHYVDSDHPRVKAFVEETISAEQSPKERAIALFLKVRDHFRYSPYAVRLEPEQLKASVILEGRKTYCVPKAIVLAAAARCAGIPARLGFADVCNHLSPPGLIEVMGTEIFAFHGYCEMFLHGRWYKTSPAFNASLCHSLGLPPLDFDGEHDALLHAYDAQGEQYMEYLHDYGTFADLPHEMMLDAWKRHYPHLFPLSES
ncbi:MAG: transglutaminase family protein [Myxococcales bacterium]|nr:transglutaminase family protein [Myxococcales bacterium]